MRNYLGRIQEELDMFSDENIMITVLRKDLEALVSAHNNLLSSQIKSRETDSES